MLVYRRHSLHIKACRNKVHTRSTRKEACRQEHRKKAALPDGGIRCSIFERTGCLGKKPDETGIWNLIPSIHARIGEAYLAAIVESLPEPTGARLKKQRSRDKYDQE